VARTTLTLSKRPDPATKPKVDPAKVSLSERLGFRFIERDHRYIAQKLVVSYSDERPHERSQTWLDIPLVPEAYIG
jgi:hypothetical protein